MNEKKNTKKIFLIIFNTQHTQINVETNLLQEKNVLSSTSCSLSYLELFKAFKSLTSFDCKK